MGSSASRPSVRRAAFEHLGYDDVAYLRTLGREALQGVADMASMKVGHHEKFLHYILARS